jgi:starch-binding outer membrane protein, SusD/RagB family
LNLKIPIDMRPRILIIAALVMSLAACDNVLDVNPTANIDSDQALVNARGVELAVTGAYSGLQFVNMYSQYLPVLPELYADNLTHTGSFSTLAEFDRRAVFSSNAHIQDAWQAMYNLVNRTNNILAAAPNVTDYTSADIRDQFMGEAYFIRALTYSHLVRYFGDVPIVTEPAVGIDESSFVSRDAATQVYAQIESDLTEAISLLPAQNEVGRATVGAARALLARVSLEQGKWAQAESAASTVIGAGYSLVPDYRTLYTTQNGPEAILEVQFTVNDPTNHSFWFLPDALGGRYEYAPTQDLVDAYEDGDERFAASIGQDGARVYANKYFRISNSDDNVFALRLAEMYLIRAEARAHQQNFDGARQDINVIRNRAGLDDLELAAVNESTLIDAVLQERRVEFAFEGHRFFDLRRTGRAQQVLGLSQAQLLWPIPQSELDRNPNLTQNPGY